MIRAALRWNRFGRSADDARPRHDVAERCRLERRRRHPLSVDRVEAARRVAEGDEARRQRVDLLVVPALARREAVGLDVGEPLAPPDELRRPRASTGWRRRRPISSSPCRGHVAVHTGEGHLPPVALDGQHGAHRGTSPGSRCRREAALRSRRASGAGRRTRSRCRCRPGDRRGEHVRRPRGRARCVSCARSSRRRGRRPLAPVDHDPGDAPAGPRPPPRRSRRPRR